MNYTLSQKQITKGFILLLLLYIGFSLITFRPTISIENYRLFNTTENPYDTIVAPDKLPVH
jgi:hypothetical protein